LPHKRQAACTPQIPLQITKSVIVGTVPGTVQGLLDLNTTEIGMAVSKTAGFVDRAVYAIVDSGGLHEGDWTNSQLRQYLLGVKSIADAVGKVREPSNPSNNDKQGMC